MKKDNVQFLCKDCERYNACEYYHGRKEDSYICKYFHLPEDQKTDHAHNANTKSMERLE